MLRWESFSVTAALAASFVLAPLGASLSAQTLTGTIEGADTRVLLTLLDLAGTTEFGTTLTNTDGSFMMEASPGQYRVAADQIGRERSLSGVVEVSDGGGDVTLVAPALPVSLMDLDVGNAFQCTVRPAGPDRLSRAVHEAMKALRMTTWLEDSGTMRLEVVHHERDLDPMGIVVVREARPESQAMATRVTSGLEASAVIESGFMVQDDDTQGFQFYPPEPGVIASEAFADSHCWRLRQDGGETLVGVAFEPVPDRAGMAEVTGVLWLDASSSNLLAMEYNWTIPGLDADLSGVGGRTVFNLLPDGSWITPETRVRLPLFQVRQEGSDAWEVGALREEVARVVSARTGSESFTVQLPWAAVSGVVRETAAGAPVTAARVRLRGTPYETFTDANGRFDMSGFLEGTYTVVAEHPSSPPGLMNTGQAVELAAGSTVELSLTATPILDMAVDLCRGSSSSQGVALLGEVTDSISGTGLAGVPLILRFQDPRQAGSPDRVARVVTGGDGAYVFCDAPSNVQVRIEPDLPGHAVRDTVVMATGPSMRTDIVVPLATELTPGGVYGTVEDFATGQPIEAVEVRIDGTNLTTLTNQNGFYVFQEVPYGLRQLTFNHLAYADRQVAVSLGGGSAYEVSLELTTEAIALEGITVTAIPRRLFRDMVGIQHRMEMGFGEFMLREDLEMRGGNIAHAIQGMAGARLVSSGSQIRDLYVVLRNAVNIDLGTGTQQPCYPAVFVDGHRVSKPTQGGVGHEPHDLSTYFTSDLEAVEVYKGAASVPGEFGGGNAACGAIIIWTRRG